MDRVRANSRSLKKSRSRSRSRSGDGGSRREERKIPSDERKNVKGEDRHDIILSHLFGG